MNFGYLEACLDHDTGDGHPERPERLPAIRDGLADSHGVEYVAPLPAGLDRITAVHDEDYVEAFKKFCSRGGGRWDADTVASPESWDAALASAGIAEWAAHSALDGLDGRETPFSIGRPPGHHAESDEAMGFCFFNNVCVAAQSAIDTGSAESVAILDIDVHHGNGTEEIFYDDGNVFYASLHEEGIYPGTGEIDDTGEGDGELTTMNLPLPAGSDSGVYLDVLEGAVWPALAGFDPDLIMVSAGFDAHEKDEISRLRVSTEGYGRIASALDTLSDELDAGLAFVLEGGYNLDTLADCVRIIHEVFDGYEPTVEDRMESHAVDNLLEDIRAKGFTGL